MKIPRRTFLHLAASATALPLVPRIAMAEAYPARPVHWVVTSAAGGTGDIFSRLIAQRLSDRLGQPFIIDNRPGAGVNIGTEAVLRAPADGYTLLIINKGNVTSAMLYDNLNFDFIRDIEPVAGISSGPLVMLVNPSVPATTVPEFIAYAKNNPARINMATVGNGSDPHLAGELFKLMTGISMTSVTYRGGALALTDLLGGRVQVFFSNLPVTEFVKTGKLRALAVTTSARSWDLPEIPPIADFVPGYEANVWFGLGVRKNTPTEIADKLNTEVNSALTDPRIKAGLADLNALPMSMTPAEFGKLIADETEKWRKVIRTANIKPE
ncbi:MAG: tripartite tricarboxylate transporter substrate binding protein [Xanthobacteraceae bacterium]|jgi:tripartite-type tricarboxylate transporter receptor subunit TctC